MTIQKYLVKKMNRRLSNVEGNRITARERKIKRTAMWAIVALLSWVIPFTTEYEERIVIENVYAGTSIEPENTTLPVAGTDEGGSWVEAGQIGESLEAKISKAFPEAPDVMIAIAKAESGMNPSAPSTTDKMADGRAFSHGLFQINLTVSKVAGVKCNEAFQGRDYKAKVINEDLFEKCVRLAHDVDTNIEVARAKYEGRGNFTAWGAYTSGAYKKFM